MRQYRQRLDELGAQLAESLRARLEKIRSRFTDAAARISAFDLRARLEAMRLRTEHRAGELHLRVERLLSAKRQRFERLILQLDERSPLRVLERGYAIVYDVRGNVVARRMPWRSARIFRCAWRADKIEIAGSQARRMIVLRGAAALELRRMCREDGADYPLRCRP